VTPLLLCHTNNSFKSFQMKTDNDLHYLCFGSSCETHVRMLDFKQSVCLKLFKISDSFNSGSLTWRPRQQIMFHGMGCAVKQMRIFGVNPRFLILTGTFPALYFDCGKKSPYKIIHFYYH
jgi:hypothetical protein